jgi:hypothetical protein
MLKLKFINRVQCERLGENFDLNMHKQYIQPTFCANGTSFDKIGLEFLHSFKRDAIFTCNKYNGTQPYWMALTSVGFNIIGASWRGRQNIKYLALCQNQRNNRQFHVFVCEIQAVCHGSCVLCPFFCKELLIELWRVFMGLVVFSAGLWRSVNTVAAIKTICNPQNFLTRQHEQANY